MSTDTEFGLKIVSSGCRYETIVADFVPDPISFKIAAQTAESLNLTWFRNATQLDCPLSTTVSVIENGEERTPTEADLSVFSFNEKTGRMQIESSDFGYHGANWNIKVTKILLLSEQEFANVATYSIDVSFLDLCYSSKIVGPKFM